MACLRATHLCVWGVPGGYVWQVNTPLEDVQLAEVEASEVLRETRKVCCESKREREREREREAETEKELL